MEVVVHLQFEDFDKLGEITYTLELACKIHNRCGDERCRRRECVKSCWVTDADIGQAILGKQLKN
jgi:hypothetical protein